MRVCKWLLMLVMAVTLSQTPLHAAEPRAKVLERLNAVIQELEAADEALRPKPKPKPKVVKKKNPDLSLMQKAKKAALALPRPMRVVIDIRSNHSDGKHSFADLKAMAAARGIEAVAFTEHDRTAVRFGIDPVAWLLGYTYERPSLYTTGVEKFVRDLQQFREQNRQMVFLGGTESIPGYYWTGMPLQDNFVLHDSDKHMITLGVERAEQVKALPSYHLKHMHSNFKLSVTFWCVAIFALLLFLLIKRQRGVALLVFASFVAFMATWLMQVRHEANADQDFITTARKQKLFVIWTHPGTNTGTRTESLGVKVKTEPYSNEVFDGPYADAFTAIYGDTDRNTSVGGRWDRYLADYLRGEKKKPLWAVSAGDFHYQGGFDTYLGDYPMDVWVRERSPAGVLMALQGGHNANWMQMNGTNIAFRTLAVADAEGHVALPGGSLRGAGPFFLVAALRPVRVKGGAAHLTLAAQVVADGMVIDTPTLPVAAGKVVVRKLELEVGDHAVRLRVPTQGNIRMEANPFFIRVVPGAKS